MRREDFVEKLSTYFGMPPFAIESDNSHIVKCDCGHTHNRDIFGKGCPGWTQKPKSAKELRREREDLDYAEHTRKVREWRRKHGYKPTALERGGAESDSTAPKVAKAHKPEPPKCNVFNTKKERRRG